MEFYLELTDKKNYFRLQKDGSWRLRDYHNGELENKDFLSEMVFELIRLQKTKTVVHINGKSYKVLPEEGYSDLTYDVYVKRNMFPLIPSKEQLVSTIRQGDDRIINSLILNVYGFFELRDFHTMQIQIDDPTLVFRYETFSPYNDYVGMDASNDSRHINNLYTTFLKGWHEHLNGGHTNMCFESEPRETENELLKAINSLRENWIIENVDE
ncbi:MAG: hypothetical protein V4565_05100 [Bacteroidota bacterium]